MIQLVMILMSLFGIFPSREFFTNMEEKLLYQVELYQVNLHDRNRIREKVGFKKWFGKLQTKCKV